MGFIHLYTQIYNLYKFSLVENILPLNERIHIDSNGNIDNLLPNQELSVLCGGPSLNYGEQLSLYVPYMLRESMTGDLAHLQLSDLQGETRPICRTSDLQGERTLICRT